MTFSSSSLVSLEGVDSYRVVEAGWEVGLDVLLGPVPHPSSQEDGNEGVGNEESLARDVLLGVTKELTACRFYSEQAWRGAIAQARLASPAFVSTVVVPLAKTSSTTTRLPNRLRQALVESLREWFDCTQEHYWFLDWCIAQSNGWGEEEFDSLVGELDLFHSFPRVEAARIEQCMYSAFLTRSSNKRQ
ncbi:hypothetical protein BASA81_000503 [Batrachochytrium salamandrivorans]|nr:hypothetical protein BASA81_000503 [Batrachochytrium salamandrivorans]